MKKKFLLVAVVSLLFSVTLPAQIISTQTVGDISVKLSNPQGWKVETSAVSAGEMREVVTIHISRDVAEVPPVMNVEFCVPLLDMTQTWFCTNGNDRNPFKPVWSAKFESQIARNMPLLASLNDENTNRVTIACDEAFRLVKISAGALEEGSMFKYRLDLFTEVELPLDDYTVKLMIDRRPEFWSKTIEDASRWIVESASIKPCVAPAAAFEPLYSSWYQFHQNVFASEIEKECAIAASLGMKTIILDDGWQTEDNHRGYAYCGDWKVSTNKFPDMKAHVDAVHKLGMKYMVWYAVPYIGVHSEAHERFKGKYLVEGNSQSVLDPRFPEVREYLTGIYETAMKEWGLDGFKLDFIDRFSISGTDPAIAQNFEGRDIKSLTVAVDVLMKEIYSRLHAINPDVLIEFRQRYVGPAIRQYGNMLRVSDCPADYHANRIHSANLRLTSGQTAVHSDMLEWNTEEKPEIAARQILSSLFATVQYSLMLRDIPQSHRKVISHWLDFSQKHKETLLFGEFLPYYPQMCLPVIEARSEEEQICAVYQVGMQVNLGTKAPITYLINASGSGELLTVFSRNPKSITTFDTFGNVVNNKVNCKKIPIGKPFVLAVPMSGYAEIRF